MDKDDREFGLAEIKKIQEELAELKRRKEILDAVPPKKRRPDKKAAAKTVTKKGSTGAISDAVQSSPKTAKRGASAKTVRNNEKRIPGTASVTAATADGAKAGRRRDGTARAAAKKPRSAGTEKPPAKRAAKTTGAKKTAARSTPKTTAKKTAARSTPKTTAKKTADSAAGSKIKAAAKPAAAKKGAAKRGSAKGAASSHDAAKDAEAEEKVPEITLEEKLESELTEEEIERFQIEAVNMEQLIRKVCDILAERESEGMLQNELWKKLKLSEMTGSRLALKLERMGTITREKLLEKNRWTYKLVLKKTPISTKSIEDAPCLVCPVEQKCTLEGEISPRTCQYIEDWVVAVMKKPRFK